MSIQPFDTFSAITTGFKYLPYALGASSLSVTVGSLAGLYDWGLVKDLYSPDCSNIQIKGSDIIQGLLIGYLSLFNAPITEEILFRGVLQDGILTRAPRKFLALFGKQRLADSVIAKTGRIGITALGFSLFHLQNQFFVSTEQIKFQLANTFGLGLVTSYLKEKTKSLWPSVGLHMIFNAVPISIQTMNCLFSSLMRKTKKNQIDSPTFPASQAPQISPLRNILEHQPFCAIENQPLADECKNHEWAIGYHTKSLQSEKELVASLEQKAQNDYPVLLEEQDKIFF